MSAMNVNGTASPAVAPFATAEQAAALNGAMNFLLLTALCAPGILIPISVALFFSFSRMWRTPVFMLNVFAVALGFAYGGLTLNYLRSVFSGQFPSPRLTLVFMSMTFFVLCVQSVLIIRVVAVLPPPPAC
ncbi:hypothetical protein GSI_12178 [Ganoderma sinense ZZ0214-1]|uniref:Uncharacterized protein n=1 Tax=Ganoderma sinense ZZ0214-1 TaxID=1077348 RepID=A0A2G8RY27_9APHY|nr:hypothetical protein GSI_12178 [Ganoderma sinense ZZ0214-1]